MQPFDPYSGQLYLSNHIKHPVTLPNANTFYHLSTTPPPNHVSLGPLLPITILLVYQQNKDLLAAFIVQNCILHLSFVLFWNNFVSVLTILNPLPY